MKTLGWLVQCEGRTLFMREREDILWAIEDSNYTVTELVPKKVEDPTTDDTVERMQILEQLYELEELQIAEMKLKLEEAMELVENIHLFSMNQTTNIMEARGLLRLIAESCQKWLKPKD